jgi:hypothetical protein
MASLKEGDYLTCEVCGLVVVVDEACDCIVSEIICCEEEPMVKIKAPAKAKKKAKPAAKPKKAAAKKVAKKAGKKPAAKAKKK